MIEFETESSLGERSKALVYGYRDMCKTGGNIELHAGFGEVDGNAERAIGFKLGETGQVIPFLLSEAKDVLEKMILTWDAVCLAVKESEGEEAGPEPELIDIMRQAIKHCETAVKAN